MCVLLANTHRPKSNSLCFRVFTEMVVRSIHCPFRAGRYPLARASASLMNSPCFVFPDHRAKGSVMRRCSATVCFAGSVDKSVDYPFIFEMSQLIYKARKGSASVCSAKTSASARASRTRQSRLFWPWLLVWYPTNQHLIPRVALPSFEPGAFPTFRTYMVPARVHENTSALAAYCG